MLTERAHDKKTEPQEYLVTSTKDTTTQTEVRPL